MILDVANVVKLEKSIASQGTSLATLMDRAGTALAEAIIDHFSSLGVAVQEKADVEAAEAAYGEADEGVNDKASNEADEDPADKAGEAAGDNPLHSKDISEESGAKPEVLVLAGSGNNGGDGWVAARHLAQKGWQVNLVSPKTADQLKAEPAHTTAQEVEKLKLETLSVVINPDREKLIHLLQEADVVVDALLGTGFSGTSPKDPLGQWVELLNREKESRSESSLSATASRIAKPPSIKPLFVIAADVPSGLSAQTGKAASPCVVADKTVTMLVLKPGLLVDKAKPYVGQLEVADLGIDASQFDIS